MMVLIDTPPLVWLDGGCLILGQVSLWLLNESLRKEQLT